MKAITPKIFKTPHHHTADTIEPVYTIRDGEFYRTISHPHGWSENPDYRLGDDGKLYRTGHHRLGRSELADYEFRNSRYLYRTINHPDGTIDDPEYELRD